MWCHRKIPKESHNFASNRDGEKILVSSKSYILSPATKFVAKFEGSMASISTGIPINLSKCLFPTIGLAWLGSKYTINGIAVPPRHTANLKTGRAINCSYKRTPKATKQLIVEGFLKVND
ncbi:hypothetical protein AVEN_78835-1 [Araneus ventricosus]|uniref:Uncharacterized protein n=1 Tax=Araneus ventricosus TaxID=182803 RepID=A0A4Y2WD35_ARAVE|nr:hypothetical protein AVEN_31588-1 [Araneus ventricosus]GBO34915.1 hypothetical protein AVEN_78835-1 [Araneus ventricosus]